MQGEEGAEEQQIRLLEEEKEEGAGIVVKEMA